MWLSAGFTSSSPLPLLHHSGASLPVTTTNQDRASWLPYAHFLRRSVVLFSSATLCSYSRTDITHYHTPYLNLLFSCFFLVTTNLWINMFMAALRPFPTVVTACELWHVAVSFVQEVKLHVCLENVAIKLLPCNMQAHEELQDKCSLCLSRSFILSLWFRIYSFRKSVFHICVSVMNYGKQESRRLHLMISVF